MAFHHVLFQVIALIKMNVRLDTVVMDNNALILSGPFPVSVREE